MEDYKVFTVRFPGHYIGGTAVVVAKTQRIAYNKIKKELQDQGLGKDLTIDSVKEVDLTKGQCIILDNGDY